MLDREKVDEVAGRLRSQGDGEAAFIMHLLAGECLDVRTDEEFGVSVRKLVARATASEVDSRKIVSVLSACISDVLAYDNDGGNIGTNLWRDALDQGFTDAAQAAALRYESHKRTKGERPS